ncbi:MAG: hypothetical protein DRP01_07110 [Archaeoglobales archaeon]|nr:MAG: hypothetical protein DRP01_07110 [Archaeoglobales archaeon]
MKRPFLPIFPFLEKYPFLSYAKLFKFDESEIKSDLSSAIHKVEEVLDGKFKFNYGYSEFLCSSCVERGECGGFENCVYPIRTENYIKIERRARESVLEWRRVMVVVSNLEDNLRLKFAFKMARIFREMLKGECDDFIFVVARDLGLRFRGFSVDFRDYLKGAVRIKSEAWKLVNRRVEKGFVHLTRDEFLRLLEEFIRDRIMERIPIKVEVCVGSKLEIPLNPECFPDCMKKILFDLNSGKNVPHTGRFSIASFLINLGYEIDKIVEVFRNAPDFDEEKTRYQVEHIAGMRGKGERYEIPSCETIKSWGLCVRDCGVDHPMRFYKRCLNERGDSGKGSSKHKGYSHNNVGGYKG